MGVGRQIAGVVSARDLAGCSAEAPRDAWRLDRLAGRLVEVTGDAAGVTACAGMIHEAQCQGELAVWIGPQSASFYPPDFAASGIDLSALPVVHAAGEIHALRAADTLLRSGGFAVMVLDRVGKARLPLAAQTRLVGLAKRYNTALLILTGQGNCGAPATSLASLRARTSYRRVDHDRFMCELCAEKDKRQAPDWTHREFRRGPDGLC